MMWLYTLLGTLAFAVVALTAFTVYQIRLERRRSDARVAALAAAIDDPRWPAHVEGDNDPEPVAAPASAVTFVVPEMSRPSRAPAFALAALVVLGAGALLVAGLNGGSHSAQQVAPVTVPSIELVSMRHALDGETLIVTGLVRNPTAAATPALSAVVSVVGGDGQVVARGESQLDAVVLGPGKETTFRVAVSDIGESARYRLAFVNGGQIVPHVDRRSDLSRTALVNEANGN